MWILEEGQILPYLRSHYPVFDQSGPVDIQCIGALEGEEKPREPDEGGLINYIFRVSNGKQSVIVKQGRSASRKNDKIVLPITAICGPSWKTGCFCGMHPTSPIMETRCSNSLLTGMRVSGFAATSCATNL